MKFKNESIWDYPGRILGKKKAEEWRELILREKKENKKPIKETGMRDERQGEALESGFLEAQEACAAVWMQEGM